MHSGDLPKCTIHPVVALNRSEYDEAVSSPTTTQRAAIDSQGAAITGVELASGAIVLTCPTYSVAEAARACGIHPESLKRRIRKGTLPALRLGKGWRIRVDVLGNLLNKGL